MMIGMVGLPAGQVRELSRQLPDTPGQVGRAGPLALPALQHLSALTFSGSLLEPAPWAMFTCGHPLGGC
ncbi:hypothetical protein C2I19_06920 [Chromobacterium alticapitis]|uniref:Uncharacterized protein n=1 Tax=Chromobacterium alticapitis TaxID=2073169 RepID=A0A2S5DI62_9NEIS|nr:hypothetical protein C2I19_06920 [Chromobacterium alticapitis]